MGGQDSAGASAGEGEMGLLTAGGWAAMTRHLKGHSLARSSIYLRCDLGITEGNDAWRLARVA
eukprot:801290-Pyramimonas_sp.AAC.1